MTGFPYSTKYLLRMFARYINRPYQSDAITPADYLERLSEAYSQVVTDIAGICPEVLYPTVGYNSIPTLTTTDNQTFTFGADSSGFALSPMGEASIYRSLNDIPNNPMVRGRDYIPLGGTAIQMPNNNTYTGTLYWRGISPPGALDTSGNHEPALFPEGARELIPLRAAVTFLEPLNPGLAALRAADYGYPLASNSGRFARWVLEWRTQYADGGALLTFSGRAVAIGSAANYSGT